MNKFGFFISVMIFSVISSCKKDTKVEPEPVVPPVIVFNFQAKVYNDILVPDTRMFGNSSNDSFTVTKFNYYISNIKLTSEDGSVYSEPESYHLIEHVEGKTSFNMSSVPEGNYISIEFLIGVDSLRSLNGAHSGALDLANNMYWNWEQGYIFFKLDGTYYTANQPVISDYGIHIGGFSGPNNCLQKCTFSLPTPLSAKNGKQASVFYKVQIDEIFIKPVEIGFDYYFANVNDKTFKAISDNYKDMFVVDKIEN